MAYLFQPVNLKFSISSVYFSHTYNQNWGKFFFPRETPHLNRIQPEPKRKMKDEIINKMNKDKSNKMIA